MSRSFLSQLVRRKPIDQLTSDGAHAGPKLKKSLTSFHITMAGIAAIIGTGIFVLTGPAAADHAGPGIILSLIITALCCGCIAFSYAELASMIPVSGSTYTYAYATLGELVAWCIGWDLLLEYCMGSSAVAVGWSAYLQSILKENFAYQLPEYLRAAPQNISMISLSMFITLALAGCWGLWHSGKTIWQGSWRNNFSSRFAILAGFAGSLLAFYFGTTQTFSIVKGINQIDLLSVVIITLLDLVLVLGVTYTAKLTNFAVYVKIGAIIIFIVVGVWHINTDNYHPFLPYGWQGVLSGASVVFFAFIGFEAVCTMAEECVDPKRDMPRGIIAALCIAGVLSIAVAAVMTGVLSYKLLGSNGTNNEEAAAMAKILAHINSPWATRIVSVGALVSITSVLLVNLFGQSRVMMNVSRDGLISPVFGKISGKTQTPIYSILIWGALASITAAIIPINELAQLTSIGTLAAFFVCCLAVIILRIREPNRERKFVCPGYPYVPIAGAVMSLILMINLPWLTWERFIGWFGIGLVIYFFYGKKNSVLAKSESTN